MSLKKVELIAGLCTGLKHEISYFHSQIVMENSCHIGSNASAVTTAITPFSQINFGHRHETPQANASMFSITHQLTVLNNSHCLHPSSLALPGHCLRPNPFGSCIIIAVTLTVQSLPSAYPKPFRLVVHATSDVTPSMFIFLIKSAPLLPVPKFFN